jgi:hypothetical protein
VLIDAELACGCAGDLCGPPDGGASDAGPSDAGAEGGADGGAGMPGSCSAMMCDMTAKPDGKCATCLAGVTGTMKNPKQCYQSVAAACQASADCVSYVGCVSACP